MVGFHKSIAFSRGSKQETAQKRTNSMRLLPWFHRVGPLRQATARPCERHEGGFWRLSEKRLCAMFWPCDKRKITHSPQFSHCSDDFSALGMDQSTQEVKAMLSETQATQREALDMAATPPGPSPKKEVEENNVPSPG